MNHTRDLDIYYLLFNPRSASASERIRRIARRRSGLYASGSISLPSKVASRRHVRRHYRMRHEFYAGISSLFVRHIVTDQWRHADKLVLDSTHGGLPGHCFVRALDYIVEYFRRLFGTAKNRDGLRFSLLLLLLLL